MEKNAYHTARFETLPIVNLGDAMSIPATKEVDENQRWVDAEKRRTVVQALARKSGLTAANIEDGCKALGVSRPRLYELLRQYRADPHIGGFVKKKPGRRSGKRVLDSEVERIIRRTITQRYLTPQKISVSKLLREIAAACAKAGKKCPSRHTVRARIEAIDPREVLKARDGTKRADDVTRPVRGSLEATDPLQIVQIDHTRADVIVVDEKTRQPISRPWLTVAIDVATRMVAGYYLSLEAPSATSVAMALRHAVLPKEPWLETHGISAPWPVSGLPDVVHLDNAREFHSRALSLGALKHGIKLDYRPVRQPRFGGHIERLIGTLMEEMHGLPGTTFSNVAARGAYASEERSVMTLRELDQWLATYVVGQYHNVIHRALGRPPIAIWRGMTASMPNGLRHPEEAQQFHIDFLPFEERLIRRNGITLFNITYWDDVLSLWAGRSKRKHRVHYDPRNLGRVYVDGPDGKCWSIRTRNLIRPEVTLWEAKAARQALLAKGRREVDEEMLFAAIDARRFLVEEASARTKALRTRRQRTLEALRGTRRPALPPPAKERDEPEAEEEFEDVILPHEIEEWS